MANTARSNARSVTVTFQAECDCWTASITTARPAKGADATRIHHVNISDLGPWLEAYAAALQATTTATV